MSFAGHVYDMIRRDKENRELRRSLRDRTKNNSTLHSKTDMSELYSNTTVEEMEEIKQATKEREFKERKYFFRATVLVIVIAILVALMLYII